MWPVAQESPQTQRRGPWHPETFAHPGKMLPDLARRIVEVYSAPGDIVLDPMCGTGTTLVAAADSGRTGIGVEIEERWAEVARANAKALLRADDASRVRVLTGDARCLHYVVGDLVGHVGLVATSPPYGCDIGVIAPYFDKAARRLTCAPDGHNYSGNRANLGHARGKAYAEAMADVYGSCLEVLHPGGLLVTVTKNTRSKGQCRDLLGETVALCTQAGFSYLQHVIALHCAIEDSALRSRPSYWRISSVRRAIARGETAHLVAHEDVAVFMKPATRPSRSQIPEVRHGQ